jgi:hypothetical protein
MWLNLSIWLSGCPVKGHFNAVFHLKDLFQDNMTTIMVEPHPCSLHQLIFLIQEPIPEILVDLKK